MQTVELSRSRIGPVAATSWAISGFFIDEIERDSHRLALPRPEIQIVARFGPSAGGGLDVHALGTQPRVRRKLICAGQRAVTARLNLGASKAVLGVSASELSGCVLELDELWGRAAVQGLLNRLSGANDLSDAATIMASAIAERLHATESRNHRLALALRAAERLVSGNVEAVATELGVSERHLRRVFRECIGLGPKEFARLARFRHALHLARQESCLNWAAIAATTGYYDQAHLIEEFRAIAGVTPRALLSELGESSV